MGIIWSWLGGPWLGLGLGFCSKVDEKKKISRQIDKEILQELKQEAGLTKELKYIVIVIRHDLRFNEQYILLNMSCKN